MLMIVVWIAFMRRIGEPQRRLMDRSVQFMERPSTIRTTFLMAATLIAAGCVSRAVPPAFPTGEVVDLSHAYGSRTIFWPTAEPFRLEKVADGVTEGGYYYAANNFFSAEHGGTHIDAPAHFAKGHQTVDQIPLDRLMGEALVIDVVARSEADRDYQVGAEDFQRWEREHGEIGSGAVVLIRTGFSRRWPDAVRYLGTAERGPDAVAGLHFPGLHPDGARWLIAKGSIKAVGIDTASIDYGQSKLFESHRLLYERDIPAFENLTALDRLPPRGTYIIALPMKIEGGSGGPLRAVAIVPR